MCMNIYIVITLGYIIILVGAPLLCWKGCIFFYWYKERMYF